MRSLLFHASEVAALIGRHRYQSRGDTLLKYLKGIDSAAYARHAGLQDRVITKHVTDDAGKLVAADVVTVNVPEAARVEKGRILYESLRSEIRCDVRCMATVPDSADAAKSAAQQVSVALDAYGADHVDEITGDDVAAMKEYCRSTIFGCFGTAQEAPTTRAYEADARTRVTKDNIYRKRKLCTLPGDQGGVAVYVGGKCDGLCQNEDGTSTLLEVKNRMNRLFNSVPDYEKIQVMCYLFVFGLADATIVERYQETSARHDVKFDDAYWSEIEAGIQRAAVELVSMTIV